MKEICVKADTDHIDEAYEFIEGELEAEGVDRRDILMLHMIVDEIFSNIANYAYEGTDGKVWISYKKSKDKAAIITFKDEGRPYNPLQEENPDITLPADKRRIGGLGVFMVKSTVDEISYENVDGMNVLTLTYLLDKEPDTVRGVF
jgi:anti-sigma regulatory factor (Ser/Thr protein kinase)